MSAYDDHDDYQQPETIGPYSIIEPLGAGGMGIVYRAVHRETGQAAALKTVHFEVTDNLAGLRREIHAARQLRHPGVVRILDDGVERGVPWYAMELVEGVPLNDRIRHIIGDDDDDVPTTHDLFGESRSLPTAPIPFQYLPHRLPSDFPEFLTLMYRLCRTLAYVHGKGIVHRDLKPGNVMVRPDGRPVLMDFGLVTQFRGAGRELLLVEGSVAGTAAYLAPEQAAGEFVDARADLYAFGVMLYEISAGRLPFNGPRLEQLLQQHRSMKPKPPSSFVVDMPPVLEQLILRLLEKQPADRYGYAEDVAQLLVEAGAEPDAESESEPAAAYLYRPRLEGRGSVVEALKRSVSAMRKQNGSLVLMGGESGIGKTSVASALGRLAAIDGAIVITGECLPVGGGDAHMEAGPLHPLRPFLRAVADLCVQGGASLTQRLVGRRIETLRDYEPSLAAVEDRRPEEKVRLGAEAVRRRLLGDLAETVAAFTDELPLLMIIDDLQWADELTMKFLSSLTPEFFEKRRLMILGLYRSDELTAELRALLGRNDVERHTLARLDDDSIGAIAGTMLAARDLPPPFVRFLAQQSDGNPFFVAEYLLAAVTSMILHRESGRWRVHSRNIDDEKLYRTLGLPDSLRALVRRRLDMLTPAALRIAEAAAVLGREFAEDVLIALARERDHATMEAVQELLERRVFEGGAGQSMLRFAHDKLREGAYDGIAVDRRVTLHAGAAQAIEHSYQDEQTRSLHYNELASHWEKANENSRAVDYYEKAGIVALRTGATRKASEFLRHLLELDQASDRVRRAFWYRLLSAASFGLGDLNATARYGSEGLQLVGVTLPVSRGGWIRAMLKNLVEQAAHLVLPRRLFRARQSEWRRLAEASHAAQRLAEKAFYTTDTVSMVTFGLISVNFAERCESVPNVARVYAMLGLITGACGTPSIARKYFAQALRGASDARDVSGEAFAVLCAATYYVTTAEWEASDRAVEEAIRSAEVTGDPQDMEIALTVRGHRQFYTGAIVDARATYEQVFDGARKRTNQQHMGWGSLGIARSLILEGHLDEALEEADNARKFCPGDHMIDTIATSHAAMARLYKGDLDAARDLAERATTLISESMPTIFEMTRAISVPCEVYLALRGRAQHDSMQNVRAIDEKIFHYCKQLRSMLIRFPIIKPMVERLTGTAWALAGNERRARHHLQRAVDAAAQMKMPIEEALAQMRLAKLPSATIEGRRASLQRSEELLEKSAACVYLNRLPTSQTRHTMRQRVAV